MSAWKTLQEADSGRRKAPAPCAPPQFTVCRALSQSLARQIPKASSWDSLGLSEALAEQQSSRAAEQQSRAVPRILWVRASLLSTIGIVIIYRRIPEPGRKVNAIGLAKVRMTEAGLMLSPRMLQSTQSKPACPLGRSSCNESCKQEIPQVALPLPCSCVGETLAEPVPGETQT